MLSTCSPLDALGAMLAGPFISAQCVGGVLEIFVQHISEHRGVLNRHAGALREERQHWMSGITDERYRTDTAAKRGLAVIKRPLKPALRGRDQRARGLGPGPAPEMAQDFRAVAGRRPARLIPLVVHDRAAVDEASSLYRIMHQMGVEPEPQIDHRFAEFRIHA